MRTFYIPAANFPQAQLVPGVTLIPVHNLLELFVYLQGRSSLKPVDTSDGIYDQTTVSQNEKTGLSPYCVQVSEIVGQEQAKRALEIAAAGGHNLFFSGPPGTGKSMLAKALPSIMPPLAHEEMLEVTHLHSLSSQDYDKIIRNPRHPAIPGTAS